MSSLIGHENLNIMQYAYNYNASLFALLQQLLPNDGEILDFGAGFGTFAKVLTSKGIAVTCVEPDPHAQETLQTFGLKVYSTLSKILDNQVEFAYSFNVLEHIEDDASVLVQLRKKIKPGGLLLLYVPAFPCLFTSMDQKVGHCRRYQKQEIYNRVINAGFEILDGRYADSIGFFCTLIYKLLDDGSGLLQVEKLRFYDRYLFPLNKIFDPILSKFFGKNLILIARKNIE